MIDGYHKIERDDSNKSKGGVGVYVADQLHFVARDDLKLKVDNCEDKWLEVQTKVGQNDERKCGKSDNSFVIGVIYRHPDHSYRTFSHKLSQNIQKLNSWPQKSYNKKEIMQV